MLRASAVNYIKVNAAVQSTKANKDNVIVSLLAGMACRQKARNTIQSEVSIMKTQDQ